MRHKKLSIDELLDREEILRLEIASADDPSYYEIIALYKNLYKQIRVDKTGEYIPSLEKVRRNLIFHLIEYGTFLKTSEYKNEKTAKDSLEDAITIDKRLPIVHYRLGFLAYKNNYVNALNHFEDALTYQEEVQDVQDVQYKLNKQQVYNCHLFLANCALFIAEKAQKGIEGLNEFGEISIPTKYEISPFYELIRKNEKYLENHSYVKITNKGSTYCSIEDCEEAFYTENTIIIDSSGRKDSVIFNEREKSLSKKHADMLRTFLLNSNESNPLTKHTFYDSFLNANVNGDIPTNTYVKNVQRLRAHLKEVGIEAEVLINKKSKNETGYYYNEKYPFMVLNRTDELF